MRLPLVLIALLALFVLPALAQSEAEVDARLDTVMGDHAPFKAAFEAIQSAVAAHDAATFAAWVAYPSKVTADGEAYSFETPEAFVEHYDEIMTEEITQVVAEQKYEDLFVSSDGVMFGDGQLWLNGICADAACSSYEVKIITIQATAS